MRVKAIAGILGGIAALFALMAFIEDTPVTNYPSSGKDVIAFGDSLIEGVGATNGNDLVSQLSKRAGVPIVNLGRSGDTSATGLARINQLDKHDPKVVILLLGGNDALAQVPVDQTRQHLSEIIEAIQAKGAVVLLLGVRGSLLSDKYEDMFKELAKTHQTAFVPDVLDGIFGRAQFMADGIHPNDSGYARMSERVTPVLLSVL